MKLSILAYNLIVAVAVAGVVQLDSSSFNQAILSNDYSTSFVAFTAPWCGHCQRLHAPLNQAANSLDGLVSFYNVNCDDSKNSNICSKYNVKGFPTLKMFNRGSKSPPKDYNGERTSAAISEWAGREMRNVVSRLGDYGALQSWLNKDTHSPHILVYTAKSSTPTLLKALGLKFPGAKFGVMKSTSRNAEVKDALGLGENDIPALFVITDGSIENAERYQGKLKYKPLNQYLQQTLPSQSKTPLSNDSKKPRTEL